MTEEVWDQPPQCRSRPASDRSVTSLPPSPRYILAVMALRIEYPALCAEFEGMTVRELVALDQQGPTWSKFLNAISHAARSELAAVNFLVATKSS